MDGNQMKLTQEGICAVQDALDQYVDNENDTLSTPRSREVVTSLLKSIESCCWIEIVGPHEKDATE